MKLLLDQNLPRNLAKHLCLLFPGTMHVQDATGDTADDAMIWAYAKANGFCIVSKDDDFRQRSLVEGHPPKVVWLRTGNCSAQHLVRLLEQHAPDMIAFGANPTAAMLIITRAG